MSRIRIHLILFIAALIVSGITAFPLLGEIHLLLPYKNLFPDFLIVWLEQVHEALHQAPDLVFYGTDWLAFGHIVIALFFIPVYLDPRRHRVNLLIGMVACVLVFPLAFICGPIRGIPFFHQLIDCAFGLFGFLYLLWILRRIDRLPIPNTLILIP